MEVKTFVCQGGDLAAEFLLTAEELQAAQSRNAAVEAAIHALCEEKGLKRLMFTRVTKMDTQSDGTLLVAFDAALAPEVKLGKYLGLEVYIPGDADKDITVLKAAAESVEADIPETYIERKTDALVNQRKQDVADRQSAFDTLSDIYAILSMANADADEQLADDELWDAAMNVSTDYTGGRVAFRDPDDLVSAMAEVLYGNDDDEAHHAHIARCLRKRAEQKQQGGGEFVAAEAFGSYLRMTGKTEAQLRADFREDAIALIRIDLLLDEVVRREAIAVTDEEFDAAVEAIAGMYAISKAEVSGLVSEATLKRQLSLDKARAMIVGSAKLI